MFDTNARTVIFKMVRSMTAAPSVVHRPNVMRIQGAAMLLTTTSGGRRSPHLTSLTAAAWDKIHDAAIGIPIHTLSETRIPVCVRAEGRPIFGADLPPIDRAGSKATVTVRAEAEEDSRRNWR